MKSLLIAALVLSSTYCLANDDSYSDEEVTWLAKNVYFEARNQGIAGQLAVAQVTLNRVKDRRFPNTIQGVVTQGLTQKSWSGVVYPIKYKCQFSWYCDGKKDKIYNWKVFNQIKKMLLIYTSKDSITFDITEGATHYHADYVYPDWADTKKKTIEIEDHIFYRWE